MGGTTKAGLANWTARPCQDGHREASCGGLPHQLEPKGRRHAKSYHHRRESRRWSTAAATPPRASRASRAWWRRTSFATAINCCAPPSNGGARTRKVSAKRRWRSVDNDRWRGEFVPAENARYVFTIEAWTDLFASWLADFAKKVGAGRDVASDLLEGIALLEAIRAPGQRRRPRTAHRQPRRPCAAMPETPPSALAVVSTPQLSEAAARLRRALRRDPLPTADGTDRRPPQGQLRLMVRDVRALADESAPSGRAPSPTPSAG